MFIYQSFLLLLIITAFSVGLHSIHVIDQGIRITYTTIQTDRNLTETSKIESAYVVSGAEVLQSIAHIGKIGADIYVDGTLYRKTIDYQKANLSMIPTKNLFSVSYIRDGEGNLREVRYVSR